MPPSMFAVISDLGSCIGLGGWLSGARVWEYGRVWFLPAVELVLPTTHILN